MSEKQFSRENIRELIVELGFDGFVDFINNQARIIEDLEKENIELKIAKVGKKVQIIDQERNHRIRDLYKACEVLNEQQEEIEELIITIKLYEADIIEKDNKIKQLKQQLDKIPPRIKEIWLNG